MKPFDVGRFAPSARAVSAQGSPPVLHPTLDLALTSVACFLLAKRDLPTSSRS